MDRSAVIHACLVSIDGVGVVISGEPGVGKTTVCLELERLGHVFVADDSVEIRLRENEVLGRAPSETVGLVAIREFGIVARAPRSDIDRLSEAISVNYSIELTAIGDFPVNQTNNSLLASLPFWSLVNSGSASTAKSIETLIRASINNVHDQFYG